MDNNNNVEVREMLDRLIIYKHSATMVTTKNASFQDDRRDIKSLYSRYQYIHKGEKKKKKKRKKKPPPTLLQHSYNSNDYLESQMSLCTQLSEH